MAEHREQVREMTSIAKRGAVQRRRDRGASIVELALIAPVMVLLVFGVLDLGRAYRTDIRLENAAREGAAFGQLFPNKVSCESTVDIDDRVRNEEPAVASLPGFSVAVFGFEDGVETEMSGCDGSVAQPGERISVEVSAEYHVVTPIVSQIVGEVIVMTGTAEVRVQGQVQP